MDPAFCHFNQSIVLAPGCTVKQNGPLYGTVAVFSIRLTHCPIETTISDVTPAMHDYNQSGPQQVTHNDRNLSSACASWEKK